MPIFADDPNDDESDFLHSEEMQRELEQAIANALNLSDQFQTEYIEDEKELTRERKRLRDARTNPWDKLLSSKEEREISHLNIEIHDTCPYAVKAHGATLYRYCQVTANNLVSRGMKKFTGAVVIKDKSIEKFTHILPEGLKKYCIENYKQCQTYQQNKAATED